MAATECEQFDRSNEAIDIQLQNCIKHFILIDTGAYLTHKKYAKDLDSVVSRAKESGILKMVVVSMHLPGSKEALRLTRLYPDTLYATAGIHPHEAKLWGPNSYNDLKALAENPEVVAIGECGLDYNRDFSPQEKQREALDAQVKLACELKKPLYLHERDAHEDMITILRKYGSQLPGGVVHCFTGEAEHAKTYISMGFHIGITGFICKDRSETGVRAALQQKLIPLARLLLESSSPYMYPNVQGAKLPPTVRAALTKCSLRYHERYCTFQRNEPCSLPVLLELVASLMKEDVNQVALTTAFNSLKLFGLS